MNVIHYAGIGKNKSSGVSVIVPEIINAQSQIMNVCFYNYGKESFEISDRVIKMNNTHDDDYHTFPEPFNEPDIVIFHSPFGIRKTVRLAKKLKKENIPYIVVPHGSFSTFALSKKRLKKWIAINILFKRMFENTSAIQYLSYGEKKASPFKIKGIIVPNGITMVEKVKRKNDEQGIKLSYIGRKDIYHKGLDLLIKACGTIKEELLDMKVSLRLYGPYEGDEGESIKRLLKENNVDNIVFDCPPVYGKNKEKAFLETDIIVLTSRFEGLPGVVLEAWSFGCPTLLTPGTNMSEEAVKNDCGWEAEDNIQDIAAKIIEICKNRDEINKKSKQARCYVRENYNWNYIAAQYRDEYREVIENNDSNR